MRIHTTLLSSLSVLALVLVTAASPAQAQQAPDPQLEIPLYSGLLGIRTAATDTPTVRVLAADGRLRLAVTPTTARPADGHWVIALQRPEDGATAMLRPGDHVEVDLAGRTTRVTVPAMRATADVDLGIVSGQLPPGSPAALLQLHRDPNWFGAVPDPEAAVHPIRPDGAFEIAVDGGFVLRPGTYGEVATADGAGHIYVVPFAVPAATLVMDRQGETTYYYASGRSDPHREPRMAVLGSEGFEVFRSGPVSWLGAGAFVVALVDNGDPQAGAFLPEPGQRLVMLLEEERAFDVPVPRHSASIDPTREEVFGFAPPDARVAMAVRGTASGPQAGTVVTADASGRYVAAFPEVQFTSDASAQVLVHDGGPAAFLSIGRAVAQAITLYGNGVFGVVAGRGSVHMEQLRQGTVIAQRKAQIDPVGFVEVDLLTGEGVAAVIRPGDRIVVRPEHGDPLTFDVPQLAARVEPGAQVLQGSAPPGAIVASEIYTAETGLFEQEPFEQDHASLQGTADDDGRFRIPCSADDCRPMRFGTVSVEVSAVTFTLHWIGNPSVGVGASVSTVIVRATSGLPVVVKALDASDNETVVDEGVVLPAATSFPRHQADLTEAFPNGMAEGDRLAIQVGDLNYDVVAASVHLAGGRRRQHRIGHGAAEPSRGCGRRELRRCVATRSGGWPGLGGPVRKLARRLWGVQPQAWRRPDVVRAHRRPLHLVGGTGDPR